MCFELALIVVAAAIVLVQPILLARFHGSKRALDAYVTNRIEVGAGAWEEPVPPARRVGCFEVFEVTVSAGGSVWLRSREDRAAGLVFSPDPRVEYARFGDPGRKLDEHWFAWSHVPGDD